MSANSFSFSSQDYRSNTEEFPEFFPSGVFEAVWWTLEIYATNLTDINIGTYPTVVMVTNDHQNPSSDPKKKDLGKLEESQAEALENLVR